ncbi:glutamyl-tRNA reductase [Actinomyces trachealis]|uniref:glutamyl-tRNA reductase n=1 Tax=Actinomyces trachealis TaxID=2763540 RepID=UPI0018928BC7|nr:glutamyl-tRNA reductase [Actinomyces trachealis]
MIHLFSADHRTHGLDVVARLGAVTARLGPELCAAIDGVRGAIVLATCNRLALLLDADAAASATLPQELTTFLELRAPHAQGNGDGAGRAGVQETTTAPPRMVLSHWSGQEAITELFATAAGLESMVVGEREIAGQLRRAHLVATREGTATGALTRAVEHASAASRRVTTHTTLAGTGRSVVAVGLDLASAQLPPLEHCRILLVGTGAYAGATVTTLRERGARDVEVYSRSDRAQAFADGHGLRALRAETLPEALTRADLVITCRGLGTPIIKPELVASAARLRHPTEPALLNRHEERHSLAEPAERPLVILDLALRRDVDARVAELPGVDLIDLAAVQRAVPAAAAEQVRAARALIAQEVAAYTRAQGGRRMDPVICGLRRHVAAVVEDEVARLRPRDGVVDAQDAARALHHLAARLLHHPTVAARDAGRDGNQEVYLDALSLVLGIKLGDDDAPAPADCPDLPGQPGQPGQPEAPAFAAPACPTDRASQGTKQ